MEMEEVSLKESVSKIEKKKRKWKPGFFVCVEQLA